MTHVWLLSYEIDYEGSIDPTEVFASEIAALDKANIEVDKIMGDRNWLTHDNGDLMHAGDGGYWHIVKAEVQS